MTREQIDARIKMAEAEHAKATHPRDIENWAKIWERLIFTMPDGEPETDDEQNAGMV